MMTFDLQFLQFYLLPIPFMAIENDDNWPCLNMYPTDEKYARSRPTEAEIFERDNCPARKLARIEHEKMMAPFYRAMFDAWANPKPKVTSHETD